MDLDISDIERLWWKSLFYSLSSLEDTLGRIDDFLSFERVFIEGDLVCLVKDEPSGQTGRVVNVDMVVDVEDIFGTEIRGVHSPLQENPKNAFNYGWGLCNVWAVAWKS
ncbi:unnamed protein product [Cuscuta epithymum]|uniref:Uncharacterized protein n=1 Tax=Cuscuta epithymum TaxID=186058 RepID=A0AAV0F603_9ASTE|nr:unnamed protein product [Cuscuta epithymum]